MKRFELMSAVFKDICIHFKGKEFHPYHVRKLVEDEDINKEYAKVAVTRTLRSLVKAGLIRKLSIGKYELTEEGLKLCGMGLEEIKNYIKERYKEFYIIKS